MPSDRALYLLGYLIPFIRHRSVCSIYLSDSNPASDYCTCDYSKAVKAYRELSEILNAK